MSNVQCLVYKRNSELPSARILQLTTANTMDCANRVAFTSVSILKKYNKIKRTYVNYAKAFHELNLYFINAKERIRFIIEKYVNTTGTH